MESYPNVHHLVSEVAGDLHPALDGLGQGLAGAGGFPCPAMLGPVLQCCRVSRAPNPICDVCNAIPPLAGLLSCAVCVVSNAPPPRIICCMVSLVYISVPHKAPFPGRQAGLGGLGGL